MPALPHLQTEETENLISTEKRPYRLSLSESLPPASREEGTGHARDSNNVNNSDRLQYSQENTLVFDGTSSVLFGESIPHLHTPLPTPSPSRLLKRPPRTQENPGQPIWVEPLGIWLPNKKKWNQYETFSSHVQLLRRTSDMFLDPLPYIPRCSHERTISALRRQRQRIQTDEELQRHERNIRIIERVKQIREVWDKWSKKAQALATEHENRLDTFRKIRDEYIDPGDIIRKKREQRIQHKRELNQERERKRKEALEKKRFKLPKIIVTQYEGDLKQDQKGENLGELYQSKTCGLVSMQLADREQSVEDIDNEATSQGNDKNILELPEMESVAHNEYYAGNLENESKEHEEVDSRVELADFKNEDSKDDLEFFEQNVVENDRLPNCDIDADHLTVELENVVLEDKDAHALENAVAQSELTSNVNSDNDESQAREEMESAASRNESTQNNVNLNVQSEIQEMSGSEKEMMLDEKQMNYLLPPAVSVLVRETFPDSGLIADADDTASFMATFAPIPLGVSNGIIPDDAMRASSVLDRYHAPSQARLNNTKEGRNGGAWKPKISDKKQYLEIDLGAVTNVMQVATQGYLLLSGGKKVQKKEKCWVESYTLSFSTDGSQWRQCTENDVVKVFKGNKDNNSVVLNSLPQPTEARFVRFIPQSWKNSIAMRVEVYGEVLEPEISSMTPPPTSDVVQQEMILEEEEEEQVTGFLCIAEDEQEFDEHETWEESTVYSVMEAASQISSQVASVPQPEVDLTVQREKQPSKSKRNHKKPKEDKHEDKALKKKKKRKKMKEKIAKLPPVVSSLSMIEDVEEEEDEHSSEAEQEEEEERLLSSPVLPEIPKRPESVTHIPPAPTRTFSMFPVRKETQNEGSKPRRRRAQTDDSIRNEILRQQLAEDRRRKLAMMQRGKREIQVRSPVLGNFDAYDGLDDFVAKYCIVSKGQAKYYRRIFNNFDEDKDGFLFSEDILEALESVNSHLLSDSHLNYIYRVLELCDCNLDSGADFKLFSVIAAFSQRVAVLDEFAKILISKLDFKELDYKLQRAKRLFLCYVDEEKKTISLEELMLGLTAGGLTADQKEQTLQVLGQTASLDFLDFLTYIPLFIHIHDHILQDPVGTVVYRSLLTA